MSVSLSSVYSQTESLRQIQQKFQNALTDQPNFQPLICQLVTQATHLTISQSYRLVVILSKHLGNNGSIVKKYAALYVLKKLVLTALHQYYIFVSARVLVWVLNTAKFQTRKGEYQRVKMYVKQLALKGNGDQVVQERQCYRLLKMVDQFLPWFAENLPTHINAEFEFMSTFARCYQQLAPKRPVSSYEHFSNNDYKKFQQNFTKNKPQNRQVIKQLAQFISLQVKSLLDQQKHKSELLKQLVHTADSHCIRTIIAQICGLLQDSSKLFSCLKLVEYLIMVGEVEFVELVKLFVVPALLGYLLPVCFVEGRALAEVPLRCTLSEEKCIVDFVCIWAKITEKVGLSTKFYQQVLEQLQKTKGNLLNVQQKHISQFLTKVLDMQKVNNDKRPYIQNQLIEQQLIKVLKMKYKYKQLPKNQVLVGGSPQWQPRASAINELNQFKESRIGEVRTVGGGEDSTYAAIFRTGFLQPNVVDYANGSNANVNMNSPDRPVNLNRNSQQMLTFKEIRSQDKLNMVGQSPFRESIKVPGKSNGEQSSFLAFDASHISKFSQYSVKKSKQVENKIVNTSGGLLKHQFMSISGAKNSINNSKSQEVVYFNRSQDFHSENSLKASLKNPSVLEQSHPQPPILDPNPSKISSSCSSNSQKSLKIHQYNQQSVSTYRFDSSHISRSSGSGSSIHDFGKDDRNFPESVPKPTFGFKRKEVHMLAHQEGDGRDYGYDGGKILGSEVSIRKEGQLSRIIEQNGNQRFLMDSQTSQIQDLSGGKHINQSIHFSQGSQIGKKETLRQANNNNTYKLGSQKTININNTNPNQQYYQSARLWQDATSMQLRKTENIEYSNKSHNNRMYANQNINGQPQRISSPSPNTLRQSLSERKYVSSSNQLLKPPKQQQQSPQQFGSSQQIQSQPQQIRTSKDATSLTKKRPVIIDQFANDKLVQLEKQLGRALEEKNQKQEELRKRENQYKLLKSKSIPYMGRKVQILKKQDQLLKLLTSQKNKQEYQSKTGEYIKPLKSHNKLSDYFLENEAKGFYLPTAEPYSRTFTKQILGSRCLLLANQEFELGYNYSQIQNQVSFYLTFFKIFDRIVVEVSENSIVLEKPVKLNLDNQPAGYQLKIKRKVKSVKMPKKEPTFTDVIAYNSISNYRFPEILIKTSDQNGQYQVYRTVIPCSILNLAKPIEIINENIEQLRGKKVIKSEPLPLSQEFMKNHKEKIQKYFPCNMGLVDGWNLLGYSFPRNIFEETDNQFIKFKITKGKSVEFELFNDPRSLLTEALTCILTSGRQ